MSGLKYTEQQLIVERRRNNPHNEPTGHFTGRCKYCGSKDLWDGETAYGCKHCGAQFMTGDTPPRMIENGTGRDLGSAW